MGDVENLGLCVFAAASVDLQVLKKMALWYNLMLFSEFSVSSFGSWCVLQVVKKGVCELRPINFYRWKLAPFVCCFNVPFIASGLGLGSVEEEQKNLWLEEGNMHPFLEICLQLACENWLFWIWTNHWIWTNFGPYHWTPNKIKITIIKKWRGNGIKLKKQIIIKRLKWIKG